MYEKPLLEKFGSFRELTRIGFSGSTDGASIFGHSTRRRRRRGQGHQGGGSDDVQSGPTSS